MTPKKCGCCGEFGGELEPREELFLCADCLQVYEQGICHRWDQIKIRSLAIKEERRGR